MYLDNLKSRVFTSPHFHSVTFIGCSDDEIREIERQLKLSLPEAYKEFLRWMGKDGGPVLKGSDCFYKHLPHLRAWADELLEENNLSGILPENSFVFFMHQGYQFAFMYPEDSENPPIYYYNEMEYSADKGFTISYNSFTDFLVDEVENTIIFIEKYQI